MDFKRFQFIFAGFIFTCFTVVLFIGCSDKEKTNTDNTYYIDLVNFTNDSLKQHVSDNIFGKVAYYKNNKLEILSLNYLTEDFPDMHYFKNAEILENDIVDDTKKIRIEFKGNFSLDSIEYSLQKFKYNNKQWVKISDMGVIRDTKKFVRPENIISEYVRLIVLNTVDYSYN